MVGNAIPVVAIAAAECDHRNMLSRPSSVVLLLVNLLPLAGIAWFGWDVPGILLLYWAESVVIGVVNVLRMATCKSRDLLGEMSTLRNMHRTAAIRYRNLPGVPAAAIKLFLIPFFIVHYGMFCFGHLSALIALFSPDDSSRVIGVALPRLWPDGLWLPLAAITASHLYSYASNFRGAGEFRHSSTMMLMTRPYGRIVAMHVAIILGGALIMYLDSPLPLLLVLVAAKTGLDLRLHDVERRKLAAADAAAA